MIKSNFIQKLNKISKATQKLPQQSATIAVNFSKERFVKKNWLDTTPEPWKPNKRKKRTGSLMVGRNADLKKSIRKFAVGTNYILIGTDKHYAEIHNKGGKLAVKIERHKRTSRKGRDYMVKAHKRKMNIPKRQFIGHSHVLMKRIESLIMKEIEKALR